MATAQIGSDSLVFGTVDAAYGYFESLEFNETIEITEAKNADGDIKDVQFSGRKIEVTGSYVYRTDAGPSGTDLDAPASITLVPSEGAAPTGTIYITSVKHSYKKDEFMVIDFDGVIYPDLA